MPRFDVLQRQAVSCLAPFPTAEANETLRPVDPLLGGGFGPVEGRPPGPIWAHQRFSEFAPIVGVEATQSGATTNYRYNPQVTSAHNSGMPGRVSPCASIPGCRFRTPTRCGRSTARFHRSW
jgi:hypothetical protein